MLRKVLFVTAVALAGSFMTNGPLWADQLAGEVRFQAGAFAVITSSPHPPSDFLGGYIGQAGEHEEIVLSGFYARTDETRKGKVRKVDVEVYLPDGSVLTKTMRSRGKGSSIKLKEVTLPGPLPPETLIWFIVTYSRMPNLRPGVSYELVAKVSGQRSLRNLPSAPSYAQSWERLLNRAVRFETGGLSSHPHDEDHPSQDFLGGYIYQAGEYEDIVLSGYYIRTDDAEEGAISRVDVQVLLPDGSVLTKRLRARGRGAAIKLKEVTLPGPLPFGALLRVTVFYDNMPALASGAGYEMVVKVSGPRLRLGVEDVTGLFPETPAGRVTIVTMERPCNPTSQEVILAVEVGRTKESGGTQWLTRDWPTDFRRFAGGEVVYLLPYWCFGAADVLTLANKLPPDQRATTDAFRVRFYDAATTSLGGELGHEVVSPQVLKGEDHHVIEWIPF